MPGRFTTALDFHLAGPTSQIVVLDHPLVWLERLRTIRVHVGFRTDLASVPRVLRPLAPSWQQSARAGVLHDYCYRYAGYHLIDGSHVWMTRRAADDLFFEALLSDGTSRWRAWSMWVAVRGFGWWSYNHG